MVQRNVSWNEESTDVANFIVVLFKEIVKVTTIFNNHYVVGQSPSCIWVSVNTWTAACQAFLSLTIFRSLPKFMSMALMMPSSLLILWCLLLLLSIFPSFRDFSNELAVCIRWPKYLSLSFTSVLQMSFQDCFPLRLTSLIALLSKGSRSLLQQHSSRKSILWHSTFFMVQLLQPYVTTGKTIALTIRTFVGRLMSLLFPTLSRFVVSFLSRSNRLPISWLQSSHHQQWF